MNKNKSNILVLNPNSSCKVTASIQQSIETSEVAQYAAFTYECVKGAPVGIVTQHDADLAAVKMVEHLAEVNTDAVIVACFSDPGVLAAKERVPYPVIGSGMAGMQMALTRGSRVGVIAVAEAAIPRHWRYWKTLGVDHAVADEVPLNLTVEQSGNPELALDRMVMAAGKLKAKGADVLLLGCAGMAGLRQSLQEQTGLFVVEPCQAAAYLALWQLSLGSLAGGSDA